MPASFKGHTLSLRSINNLLDLVQDQPHSEGSLAFNPVTGEAAKRIMVMRAPRPALLRKIPGKRHAALP